MVAFTTMYFAYSLHDLNVGNLREKERTQERKQQESKMYTLAQDLSMGSLCLKNQRNQRKTWRRPPNFGFHIKFALPLSLH